MEKKTVSAITLTLLLLSMLTLALNVQPVRAEPRIWTVDDDGPADFTRIQDAIWAASSEDTIYVHNGTYYEGLYIYKSLTIIGEDKSNTVIDGSGIGRVIAIYANNVTLSGFTVQNGGWSGMCYQASCIYFYFGRASCNISDNIVLNSRHGICLIRSTDNIIVRNTVSNTERGITLVSSDRNIIVGNTVSNCESGIAVGNLGILDEPAFNNTIAGNNVSHNNKGVWIYEGINNSIAGNNITNSMLHGIGLEFSDDNKLVHNAITNTYYWGIEMHHSDRNTITGNNFVDTKNGSAILVGDSRINQIYHNNFINNDISQAFVYGSYGTVWDDGYPSGGNYWNDHMMVDDYSGVNQDELGSDGIVDEPYIIDDCNRDHYPLVGPWSPVIPATIDVDPDTLNIHSRGRWITAYIQLPEEHNPEDVDTSTILLNETIQPVLDPKYDFVTNSSEYILDHDGDGILERMVKFNRTEVTSWVFDDLGIQYGDVTLPITGQLLDGTPFEGTVVMRVLFPGDVDGDGYVGSADAGVLTRAYGTSSGDLLYVLEADFDEDGYIGSADAGILSGNYGKTAV